jgi:predicted secreted hydrolase
MSWKVTIPDQEIELKIAPEFLDQELVTNRSTRVTYWEGAVRISGTARKKPIAGAGYVEMTGYASKLKI